MKATEELLEKVKNQTINDQLCLEEMKLALKENFEESLLNNSEKCILGNCHLESAKEELEERVKVFEGRIRDHTCSDSDVNTLN